MSDARPWVFCQIGAREHYVLAREMQRRGLLRALVTDAWAPPASLAARLPGASGGRLAERYHPGLADAAVVRFTGSLLAFEARQRLLGAANGWDRVIARNRWFEAHAARALREGGMLDAAPIVFAYSYAARDIFRAAKAAGCTTVLGQIDPGKTEEDIVAAAVARHADLRPRWERAPAQYWEHWGEECALADRIVVNSTWARDGLRAAGVAGEKLRVVPLAYEGEGAVASRAVPRAFDARRPLRVLFLGSFIIRKGAAELLEAARLLADAPVEFHIVGHADGAVEASAADLPRVIFRGAVPRQSVGEHFATADLFILPTLSDGFGLTLLEAQAAALPVIASARCGDVVRDAVDGVVLPEVSGPAIADAVRRYLDDTGLVVSHAAAAQGRTEFTPHVIGDRLLAALD